MTLVNPVAALRHDLRTPVNHIVGYAEMLLEDLEAPEHAPARAALQQTIKAAREVLVAISSVLAPTRVYYAAAADGYLPASLARPATRPDHVPAVIELFFPFEMADNEVLERTRSTVEHCRRALSLPSERR